MAAPKAIKQRIRSVRNTSQITKAMEVVSATKMRKSQQFALRARPYARASLEILQNLITRTRVLPPLFQARPAKTASLLIVTSDKGLAGAFNANVLKKADAWIKEKRAEGIAIALVAVGKKARDYAERIGMPARKSFWGFGDFSSLHETAPVADALVEGFLARAWDSVDAAYTNFRTTLVQESTLKKILPVSEAGIEEAVRSILPERGRFAESPQGKQAASRYTYEYKLEPSPETLLSLLVPQLIRMHIHHTILESNASEHSARMVAMKNASENAKELIGDLSRIYNNARQAGITRELAEITAGREALESN